MQIETPVPRANTLASEAGAPRIRVPAPIPRITPEQHVSSIHAETELLLIFSYICRYAQVHWPKLSAVMQKLFSKVQLGNVSHEELFRTVYYLCSQKYAARLYNDTLSFVDRWLDEAEVKLSFTDDQRFIPTLSQLYMQYKTATETICGLMGYLEKNYVNKELSTSLQNVFIARGRERLILKFKSRVLACLPQTVRVEDPAAMMALITGLHELDAKEFDVLNPWLFSLYVPNLLPARGLEHDWRETLEIVDMWRTRGFPLRSSKCGVKRKDYQTD